MPRGKTEPSPEIRCAIYTRVSTAMQAAGEFSSIDNQREAAESLIKSQSGNGWLAIEPSYDDAGFSASTVRRPALQRLLADIQAKRVDIVIVYKLDRLSRNQRDLLELLDDFEDRGVAFKSVTQNFDTTGPMGRAMIGMLGVFAELERGMISERTRDKMLAARRHGEWTGGPPPLGYDLVESKLVPNVDEAVQVRAILELYTELGSVTQTVHALNQRGLTTKSWTTKTGHFRVGKPFSVGTLRRLLTNPVHVGRVACKGEVYEGQHDGIVDPNLWDSVQSKLAENGRDGGRKTKNSYDALLKGLLRCDHCDAAMTPTYTKRGSKFHRYYLCTAAQKNGWASCPTTQVKMADMDRVVIEQIRRIGNDSNLIEATIAAAQVEKTRQTKLAEAEIRSLDRELRLLGDQEDRLAAAAGQPGRSGGVARRKLDELATQGDELEQRLDALRKKHVALEATAIDSAALRQAIAQFNPIWDALHPQERIRVVQLVIEEIRYDGEADELAIQFASDGVRSLLGETGHEGAAA